MTQQYEELIQNTRLYIDYIEDHYNKVQIAFRILEVKLKEHLPVLQSGWFYPSIKHSIENHDKSKFSPEEFIAYRRNFFPCKDELKNEDEFPLAWRHHYSTNDHHWQYWTLPENDTNGILTMHMQSALFETVVDWTAMGYRFGNSAHDYLHKHWEEIKLPEFAKDHLDMICVLSNS